MSNEVYKAAISKWGEPLQLDMVIEEMSELIKEIIKHKRGKGNLHALSEEIADVQIMLAQLQIIFNNQDLVEHYKMHKIKRLEELLKG